MSKPGLSDNMKYHIYGTNHMHSSFSSCKMLLAWQQTCMLPKPSSPAPFHNGQYQKPKYLSQAKIYLIVCRIILQSP